MPALWLPYYTNPGMLSTINQTSCAAPETAEMRVRRGGKNLLAISRCFW